MTDYLLKFDSPEDVDIPLGNGPCWLAGSKTVMPVKIVVSEAVYSEPDETGNVAISTAQELATGDWYVVATDEPFTHPKTVPWADNPGRVTPTFAGRDFPGGA